MNMTFIRKLPIPMEIKEQYPLSPTGAACKAEADRQIRAILDGDDSRWLVVVGPCSADREDSVLEYAQRLRILQEKVQERFLLVMRVFTEKPRTTGEGYKGMLHQPDPSGEPDLLRGILAIRALHRRVLEETGLPTADEMLYPEHHRYLNDLLSYVTVGARSVEDQQHRLVASGLAIPVGMKNPVGGDIPTMLHAVHAAWQPHRFLYRGWEVQSQGNPYAHAILRGYVAPNTSAMHPNYDASTFAYLAQCAAGGGRIPAVLVDVSHANAGKRYEEQIHVAQEVMALYHKESSVRRMLRGLMLESYLEDGAQPVGGGRYGCSITDPCLGFTKTERLLCDLAERL